MVCSKSQNFLLRRGFWSLFWLESQRISVPIHDLPVKNHISTKNEYFSTNLFRSIHIPETFLSGTSNYRTSCSLGTRSKATLSKCIIAISFCFSYLSGDRCQIQKYARNAFLGCVSIQQKKFHEKRVSVAKVRIFLLKSGFGYLFQLESQWASVPSHDPSSEKITSL